MIVTSVDTDCPLLPSSSISVADKPVKKFLLLNN